MKTAARILAVLVPLATAVLACDPLATPTVLGNVVAPTILTLPPVWTPTWDGKPSPIPGWVRISGHQVELQLPATYFGGDPAARTEELTNLAGSLPRYAWLADLVRADPAAYALLAVDPAGESVVTVTVRDVPVDRTMARYVETWIANSARPTTIATVIERNVVHFRDQDTGRVILEIAAGDQVSWQLSYLVRREGQVWAFTFAVAKD
ncbi:MAG TPA: hypothetical protein VFI11_12515, partial [Anaerolineales bacterium]|nr:hypothetical protein [Anaerolineales bacterium]